MVIRMTRAAVNMAAMISQSVRDTIFMAVMIDDFATALQERT